MIASTAGPIVETRPHQPQSEPAAAEAARKLQAAGMGVASISQVLRVVPEQVSAWLATARHTGGPAP